MSKNLLIVVGAFLAIVIVGVVLMMKSNTKPQVSTAPAQVSQSNETAGVREITVKASEYSFSPSSLVLKKGERVRLTLTNEGRMTHSLIVEGLNVGTDMVSPGKSSTIEFVVPDTSELTYFCNVSNHRALGMEGKIKIE